MTVWTAIPSSALGRGSADSTPSSAHYACVMVLVRHAADPQPLVAEGIWRGVIVDRPRGSNGFGYDRGFQDFLWLRGQGDAK